MTVLEKRYMEIVCRYLPQLEKSVKLLNENVEKLVECITTNNKNNLQNESGKSEF